MKDRIRDRVLSGILDSLTYAGLVIIGLVEKAGSLFRAFLASARKFAGTFFSSKSVRSLLVFVSATAMLFLLLIVRLTQLGVGPAAGTSKLIRVTSASSPAAQEEVTEYGRVSVSKDVMQYEKEVTDYAARYGMDDYIPLIYAVIEQESGGSSADVMQSSTCFYNEEYSQIVGGITDTDYSIQCGVQYLKYCLGQANVSGPADISKIKLALQGYNYGHNYIGWALKRDGGYTKENAEAFADLMQRSLGWTSYGDEDYPEHVLRYYVLKQSG